MSEFGKIKRSSPCTKRFARGRMVRREPARIRRPTDVTARTYSTTVEGTDQEVTAMITTTPGGGKVGRFRLVERARAAGAQVRLSGPDQDAASLARGAVAEGAVVLGVAGGDGTVSAVAAVIGLLSAVAGTAMPKHKATADASRFMSRPPVKVRHLVHIDWCRC